MPQTNTFDPEIHLESFSRCLKEYAEDGFNNAVKDQNNNPAGLQLYDIVMEFPGTEISSLQIPLTKTLIHFAIDDQDDRLVGLGDNIFAWNHNPTTDVVNPQEAGLHLINCDVGVWSSDRSGGVTARLKAQQILRRLFHGSLAIERMREATNGGDGCLEIISYKGGGHATERINDIDIYRMVGGELVIRVFSRTPNPEIDSPAIDTIVQAPGLTILG